MERQTRRESQTGRGDRQTDKQSQRETVRDRDRHKDQTGAGEGLKKNRERERGVGETDKLGETDRGHRESQ